MIEQSLKCKTAKGLLWSSVERFSVQGVQFLVLLVIARILDPADFGLVGMLAIFLAIAQTLIDSGFSQALIRKQGRTETDNSTVFYFNIAISGLLYLFLFFIAPWVAEFYNEPQLCGLMRVLCLVVIINSFAVVQRALYTASLDFKTQAKASFVAAITSGSVGIFFAISGYGVWTLVWQQLLNAGVNTILLWLFSKWHPKLVYSRSSFKELFSFGSKLMASGLLDTIYNNMYTLIIGKVFNATSLGYYYQADRFTQLPSSNITGIIQRVTYPILCSIQDDDERLKTSFRRLLKLSAIVVFPLMSLLAGISTPLVSLILGEKWNFTATLIIPLSFMMMWWPLHVINLCLLQVKGRSDLFLKLEIIKKSVGVCVLAISIPFGLVFMCYASVLTSIICLIINTHYTGKLIQVDFILQMKDLSKILIASCVMFIVVILCVFFIKVHIYQLVIGIFVGVATFLFICWLFNLSEIGYFISVLKENTIGRNDAFC